MRGMDVGFNAVMMDSSSWSWEDSVARTSQLVREAHARGVAVEAELGRLPNATADGIDDATASLTDPDQAAQFVAHTGVDCLAVSIGNVHLLTGSDAPVDLTLLGRIHNRVRVPLVIHGGTSFPPSAVPQAIQSGVLKFNVGTGLKRAFFDGLREAVQELPVHVNVHDVLGSHKATDVMHRGKARMRDKVRELMRLFGSSGKHE
ncbi:MAG: hypothetical protein KatS3mg053_3897 [Candidatus Roseilinea sp.]|nr:MAG: hypothetical protein KatS3mg053_3897 [Candidatus Roseilinea sp.]